MRATAHAEGGAVGVVDAGRQARQRLGEHGHLLEQAQRAGVHALHVALEPLALRDQRQQGFDEALHRGHGRGARSHQLAERQLEAPFVAFAGTGDAELRVVLAGGPDHAHDDVVEHAGHCRQQIGGTGTQGHGMPQVLAITRTSFARRSTFQPASRAYSTRSITMRAMWMPKPPHSVGISSSCAAAPGS